MEKREYYIQLVITGRTVIFCKGCGREIYLTPHSFWNIKDFGVRCKNCGTINTITFENGELKKTGIVITFIGVVVAGILQVVLVSSSVITNVLDIA